MRLKARQSLWGRLKPHMWSTKTDHEAIPTPEALMADPEIGAMYAEFRDDVETLYGGDLDVALGVMAITIATEMAEDLGIDVEDVLCDMAKHNPQPERFVRALEKAVAWHAKNEAKGEGH